MRRSPATRSLASLLGLATCFAGFPAAAQPPSSVPTSQVAVRDPGNPDTYSTQELVDSGHHFFGGVSRGLALAVQEAVRRLGQPTGYILGQEASGAFIGGLRYGEGTLYSRGQRRQKIFWQGPSVGFDAGGEGSRSMMLIYNMRGASDMYKRFIEVEGTAYFVAGFGFTTATADDVVLVPIRSGVGLRLGVNLGYIKFSEQPTWNPF